MRTVFTVGTALAAVWLAAGTAIRLLNQPSDWSVAAGYFLLLGIVTAGVGAARWLVRRRR